MKGLQTKVRRCLVWDLVGSRLSIASDPRDVPKVHSSDKNRPSDFGCRRTDISVIVLYNLYDCHCARHTRSSLARSFLISLMMHGLSQNGATWGLRIISCCCCLLLTAIINNIIMSFLQGITVLDFTRLLPGPAATRLLLQMGATVVKVESTAAGRDYLRNNKMGALYAALNHGKEIVTVKDFHGARDEILTQLVPQADVLVEQFRPGTMDRWGLGYRDVKQVNPQLVYCSLTGYGQGNAKSQTAGHDLNYLASAGLLSLLTQQDDGKPVVPGFQMADICGGSYVAVMAVQAALLQRQRTGVGFYLDVSMVQGLLPLLTLPLQFTNMGAPSSQHNPLNGNTFVNYAVYQTSDHKWLSVAALEVKFWNCLAAAVGKLEWQVYHLADLSVTRFDQQVVVDLFLTKTRDEWMALLSLQQDVCVAPVLTLDELEDDPYLQEIGALETFSAPSGDTFKGIALPFSFKE